MCRSLLTWAMAAALPLLIDARAGSAPFPEIPNAEAVAAAAKIPTSFNTGACRFNTVSKFFPAVVNYAIFDGNWNDPNQTFFQQYHIVDEFWQPGGPILFYQGGEGPLYCPSAFGYLTDLTKEFGAMFVAIEHRYFGVSVPHNLNASDPSTWDKDFFKQDYNLEFILQDTVALLRWIREVQYPEARDSKIVNMGGSYNGFLGTVTRIRYPDFFWATYLGGTPTKFITDPNSPLANAWGASLSNLWNDLSPESTGKVTKGFKEIHDRFESGNTDELQTILNLCTKASTANDLSTMLETIGALYILAAQSNDANSKFVFDQVINATLAEGLSHLEAVNASIQLLVKAQNPKAECFDWEYHPDIPNPFDYATCTFIPLPVPISDDGMILGNKPANKSQKNIIDAKCMAAFGIEAVDGGEDYAKKLGLDDASLQNMTRTIFTYGQNDPTLVFAPAPWAIPKGGSREGSRIFWYSGGAHGTEIFTPEETDSAALKEVRAKIRNLLRTCLGLDRAD